jgi:spore coat protein U-like protein
MRLIGIALAVLAFVLSARPAVAQSCSFAVSNFNFGNISIGPGGTPPTSSTLTATCSGQPGRTITVCPNIGDGTGGSANGTPRYLLNGSNRIGDDLLQPNGQVWGSFVWPYAPRPPVLSLTLNAAGTGSLTQTITAAISGSIAGAPTGLYVSTYTTFHTLIDYGYAPGQTCGGTVTHPTQAPFSVQANVVASCSLATLPMDFGTLTGLTTAQQAASQLSVTCTQGAPYTVTLSNGSNGGTGPAQRLMASPSTTQKLSYGVYKDATHTLPWGQTPGVDTLGAAGSGAAQNYNLYGYLPAQAAAAPGAYSDTIVVTVNY